MNNMIERDQHKININKIFLQIFLSIDEQVIDHLKLERSHAVSKGG